MPNALYDENLARLRKAIQFEEVDKIPISLCGNAAWARMTGMTVADYITKYPDAVTNSIKIHKSLGSDTTQNFIFSPYLLPSLWLSEVAIPGEDLPEDDLWQVKEKELMKFDQYSEIIDEGWNPWYTRFIRENCGDPERHLQSFYEYTPTAIQRYTGAGIPCTCYFLIATPFELMCGGRGLMSFFVDLVEEPDIVEKAFEIIMADKLEEVEGMLKAMKPLAVWIGGWRTSPNLISMDQFDRFVWPYMKEYANLCLKYDVVPVFHLDSCWDLALSRFLELPEKSCIMALDSVTDIRLARATLGEHMAILGDIPATLLSLGTKQECADYTRSVIDDIGPRGYIFASGCDVPINAKYENLKAACDVVNNYL